MYISIYIYVSTLHRLCYISVQPNAQFLDFLQGANTSSNNSFNLSQWLAWDRHRANHLIYET